jgi:alkylhydroperoxidase/carboxymuconolactone decarboxylase family protein YurZ
VDNLKKLPKLAKNAPEATKAFWAYDKAALADGAIPKKYKELMAVAVALTTVMRLLHRDSPEVGSRSRCD